VRPFRVFGYYALPVALLAALLALFAGLGAKLHNGIVSALDTGQNTLPTGIMVQPGAILGGQALRVGEAITPGTSPATTPVGGLQRPVGSFVYARDGATAFMKTGTAAAAWSAVGTAGAVGVSDALTSRAAALTGIDPTLLSCYHEEFFSTPANLHSVGAGGGATAVISTAANAIGSLMTLATSATASSRVRVFGTGVQLGRPDTNPFYFAQRQAFTTAVDAQAGFTAGIADRTASPSLGLGVCGNASTTIFQAMYDQAAPCAATKLSTGVAIDANRHLFETWSVADAKVHFAVDGIEIPGSPVTPSVPFTAGAAFYDDILNGTTAANRSVDIDYFHLCWSQQ
jgi:hypothetical protein